MSFNFVFISEILGDKKGNFEYNDNFCHYKTFTFKMLSNVNLLSVSTQYEFRKYSDDSLIRTRLLFPVDISGLTSFPDY